jgi:hypothetical protein
LCSLIIFYWRIFFSTKSLLYHSRSFGAKAGAEGSEHKTIHRNKYMMADSNSHNSAVGIAHPISINVEISVRPSSPSLNHPPTDVMPLSASSAVSTAGEPILVGFRAASVTSSPMPTLDLMDQPAIGTPQRRVLRPSQPSFGTAHILHPSPSLLTATTAPPTNISSSSIESISMRLAQRSILFVVIFFMGWIFSIICSIYELSTDTLPPWLDATAASLGCAHTLTVPLAYGWTNRRIRIALAQRWSFLSSCCLFGDDKKIINEPSIDPVDTSAMVMVPAATGATGEVQIRRPASVAPRRGHPLSGHKNIHATNDISRSSEQRPSMAFNGTPPSNLTNQTRKGGKQSQNIPSSASSATSSSSLPLSSSGQGSGHIHNTNDHNDSRFIRTLTTPGLTVTITPVDNTAIPIPSITYAAAAAVTLPNTSINQRTQ